MCIGWLVIPLQDRSKDASHEQPDQQVSDETDEHDRREADPLPDGQEDHSTQHPFGRVEVHPFSEVADSSWLVAGRAPHSRDRIGDPVQGAGRDCRHGESIRCIVAADQFDFPFVATTLCEELRTLRLDLGREFRTGGEELYLITLKRTSGKFLRGRDIPAQPPNGIGKVAHHAIPHRGIGGQRLRIKACRRRRQASRITLRHRL